MHFGAGAHGLLEVGHFLAPLAGWALAGAALGAQGLEADAFIGAHGLELAAFFGAHGLVAALCCMGAQGLLWALAVAMPVSGANAAGSGAIEASARVTSERRVASEALDLLEVFFMGSNLISGELPRAGGSGVSRHS